MHSTPRRYATNRNPRNSRSGYALADLLAWVAIAGILAAIAFPRLGQFQSQMSVDSAAQRLASAVAVARTQAAATGTMRRVRREGTTAFRTASNELIPLDPGVAFSVVSTDSVAFGPFGPPLTPAVFILTLSGVTKQVVVSQGGMVVVR
jgi:hypothetical protein